jgi:hypothetical protein
MPDLPNDKAKVNVRQPMTSNSCHQSLTERMHRDAEKLVSNCLNFGTTSPTSVNGYYIIC